MAQAIPFSDFVVIVAPFPKPGSVVEGWMARIRAVDEIFADQARIYLNFDASAAPDAAPAMSVLGSALEFKLHPFSDLHRATVEAAIAGARFVYVHTVHLSRFVLGYFPSGKIVVDFHGAAPEEEAMLGNAASASFYEGVERSVIAGARYAVVVTMAMADHLRAKYPDLQCAFIWLPIMESHEFDLSLRRAGEPDRYSVIYAGGAQVWQNLPLMLDAAARAEADCAYTFLSHDQSYIAEQARRLAPAAAISVATAGREELPAHYAHADLGFVLRDDSVVNRVACPTKLIEYMQFGVVPIVKFAKVGDFAAHGYQYVTLDEFVAGVIPNRAQLSSMARANLAVLQRLRSAFDDGAGQLRALRAENRIVGGGLAGLPVGCLPQLYPARRELYVFGEAAKYVADWITAPYERHLFHCPGAMGQLIRINPCLMDFSVSGIELEIDLADKSEAEIEVVQSRAKSIGGRDFYYAEAPYFELKFSKCVDIRSVGLRLIDPAFGPQIWRSAALQENDGDKSGAVLHVSLRRGGQHRRQRLPVEYL